MGLCRLPAKKNDINPLYYRLNSFNSNKKAARLRECYLFYKSRIRSGKNESKGALVVLCKFRTAPFVLLFLHL